MIVGGGLASIGVVVFLVRRCRKPKPPSLTTTYIDFESSSDIQSQR